MTGHRSQQEREQAAATHRALVGRPLTLEEALDFGLLGWNLRCNRCGSHGAEWLPGERPGWSALALCPPHRDELRAEQARHAQALRELRQVSFSQLRQDDIDAIHAMYQDAQRGRRLRRRAAAPPG